MIPTLPKPASCCEEPFVFVSRQSLISTLHFLSFSEPNMDESKYGLLQDGSSSSSFDEERVDQHRLPRASHKSLSRVNGLLIVTLLSSISANIFLLYKTYTHDSIGPISRSPYGTLLPSG
jgi:hypothetical protein